LAVAVIIATIAMIAVMAILVIEDIIARMAKVA